MSNRSYAIVLVKQTFIHSWRIAPQTFVNSVSNKKRRWTHTRHRVQQTHCAFLDQGSNWFGAPATNARRVSEANRILNRTNPPIVAKIKDCENCTHAKFAQFSNNWQRFFPTHVCDTSCQSLTHAYRKLIKVGYLSRCVLTCLCSWHMSNYSYVVSATCRAQMFPLC